MQMRTVLLSALSAAGLALYVMQPFSEAPVASVLFILPFFFFYLLWDRTLRLSGDLRAQVFCLVYALLLSACTVSGKLLDHGIDDGELLSLLTILLLLFTLYPALRLLTDHLQKRALPQGGTVSSAFLKRCLIAVAILWFLVYLAAFPGIYAVDAMTWYLSFSDPSVPVTAQWSPVYAGLFYFFVHTGSQLTGSFLPGMAVFSFLQMVFCLYAVSRVLIFVSERAGKNAVLATTLFFAVLPAHAVMAVQTVQGAPAMAASAMVLIHIVRMTEDAQGYLEDRKNGIAFVLWGIAVCVLRNNLYVVFVLLFPLAALLFKTYRQKILLLFAAVIVCTAFYKGPVLKLAGVEKGPTAQESLSLPLQQLACVYALFPDRMDEEDRALLRAYVPEEKLLNYERESGISDAVKGSFDSERFSANPAAFFRLWLRVGLRAPKAYIRAALLQNAGLLYVDKQYPDARIYHPYLNYASYELDNPLFIHITRRSLIPPLDRLFLSLFGNADHSYGGDTDAWFNAIPLIGPLCRASVYVWALLFMVLCRMLLRAKLPSLPQCYALLVTLSLFFGPVIVYRYYAPVIFAFPVLLAEFLSDRRQ